MIKDIRLLHTNESMECDVCIVGAGAAGITLAMELEKKGRSIVLLEGGGLDAALKEEEDLYDGSTGEQPYPIRASRLRYFGGTTNHWGGWSRPLDAVDFKSKTHVPLSGWPITGETLLPYYKRAAKICEIKGYESYTKLEKLESENTFSINNGTVFTNKYFLFSPPTRFGKKYRSDIEESKNIKCYLHANVTRLLLEKTEIKGVEIQTLEGYAHRVESNVVVLAMGGLENTRILLANKGNAYPQGVGNHSDFVGRCFMDHPGFRPCDLVLQNNLKYHRHSTDIGPVMPVLSVTESGIHEHKINNVCMILNQDSEDKVVSGDYLKNAFLKIESKRGARYIPQFIFEPTPNPDSRVTLSEKVDRLGVPKLHLDWKINSLDFRSVEKVVDLLISELGASGLGRVKKVKAFTPENIKKLSSGMHHMGTTRMSHTERSGVVNQDCGVFDTKGLYIAGSSVFPTTGFSNPTLTIVALAVRLADHISAKLND